MIIRPTLALTHARRKTAPGHHGVHTHSAIKLPNLQNAASQGDIFTVRRLLHQADLDVNEGLGDGRTALHAAAQAGHLAVVAALLLHGADPNKRSLWDITALYEASCEGHAAVVTLLLLCGADPLTRARDGLTPLHKAAEFGRARAALALLEHPAVSPDCQSAFGTVPLIPACVKNHKGVVRVLLNARADPSLRAANSGLTPLQVACVHSAAAAAAELLAAGADPNDAGGRHPSPLHLAVHNISPECARVLIAAGADTGAVFRKPLLQVLEETPLRGMVPKERVDAVKNAVQNALEIRAEAIFWRRSPLLMMRELVLRGRAVLRGSVQPARVGRAPCASGAAEKAPLGSKEGSGSDYGGVNAPSATCEYAAGSGAEESCDGAQRSAFDDSSGHPAKAVQHGSVMDSAQEIGSSCNAHVDAAGGVVLGPLLRMVMDLPDNPFAAVVLFL